MSTGRIIRNVWRKNTRKIIDAISKKSMWCKQRCKWTVREKDIYISFSDDKAPLYHKTCDTWYWSIGGIFIYLWDKSDEDDWRKLRHLMNHLKKNIENVSIIEANIVQELFTWVDSSYAMHVNNKIQTGGTISFRNGTLHCLFWKKTQH